MIIDKILTEWECNDDEDNNSCYKVLFNNQNGDLYIQLEVATLDTFPGKDNKEKTDNQTNKLASMWKKLTDDLNLILGLSSSSPCNGLYEVKSGEKMLVIKSLAFKYITQYINTHYNETQLLSIAMEIVNKLLIIYRDSNNCGQIISQVLTQNINGLVRYRKDNDNSLGKPHQFYIANVFPDSPDAQLKINISKRLGQKLQDAFKHAITKILNKSKEELFNDLPPDTLTLNLSDDDFNKLKQNAGIYHEVKEYPEPPEAAQNVQKTDQQSASVSDDHAKAEARDLGAYDLMPVPAAAQSGRERPPEGRISAYHGSKGGDEDDIPPALRAYYDELGDLERMTETLSVGRGGEHAEHEERDSDDVLKRAMRNSSAVSPSDGKRAKQEIAAANNNIAAAEIADLNQNVFKQDKMRLPLHNEKENLIKSVQQKFLAVHEIKKLTEMYKHINLPVNKLILNIHEHHIYDTIFFKTNTNSWQNLIEEIRNHALRELFCSLNIVVFVSNIKDADIVDAIKNKNTDYANPQILKNILMPYLTDPLFCEHRSNNHFRNLFHSTKAVKILQSVIDACDAQIKREGQEVIRYAKSPGSNGN